MTAEDKKKIIEYLRDNPRSSAKDIRKALDLEPLAHSAALYSMKNTGLILELHVTTSKYPVYSVNPKADPEELAEPRNIFKRKRGHNTKHRIGTAELAVLNTISDEYVSLDEAYAKIEVDHPKYRKAYVAKLINRLEEIGALEREGEFDGAQWRNTGRYPETSEE